MIDQGNHHAVPPTNLTRLVDLFAQDITFAVTRGKHMQEKHFLLGQGLHNLTGSRKVIDIAHKLGHCTSYNTVCEIETAAKRSNILPLQPASPNITVLTHFWVDNFDVKVVRMGGGGSIDTTHLMAFQEDQNHQQAK